MGVDRRAERFLRCPPKVRGDDRGRVSRRERGGPVLAAGLMMLSAGCLLVAGALLIWPPIAGRVAEYRYHLVSTSFWGRPMRRTKRYTQLCGVTVFLAGGAMLVWSVQI